MTSTPEDRIHASMRVHMHQYVYTCIHAYTHTKNPTLTPAHRGATAMHE